MRQTRDETADAHATRAAEPGQGVPEAGRDQAVTPSRRPPWRVPAAAATAALLLPTARASGCTTSADIFSSPHSGVRYAINGGCPFTDDYLNRFKSVCGAIPTGYDVGYTLWDIIKYTASSTLRRDGSHADARDATFEPCIKSQQSQENGHTAAARSMIIGIVLGGAALLLLGIALTAYCCNRRPRRARRDVELAPTQPLPMLMPNL